jgi:REP element-mobilizing transposase RayT
MVLAYHVILSAYGFWLPNDQRGSWSDFVRRWELLRFGPATKVDHTRSVAREPFDPALRAAAKRELMYEPVHFNGVQARAIGRAFQIMSRKSGYRIYALAILEEHLHAVIGRHHYNVEQIVNLLKGAATRELLQEGIHPFQIQHQNGNSVSCWSEGLWKVYLDAIDDIERAINYVEENPEKEQKPRQRWNCVVPFEEN